MNNALQCTAATFYSVSVSEPIPVRFGKNPKKFENFFQTDSSSVRKKILKNLRTFSEPILVRFGIFGKDFLITFPNRFQFGLEKIFEIGIAFSDPNSIEQKL